MPQFWSQAHHLDRNPRAGWLAWVNRDAGLDRMTNGVGGADDPWTLAPGDHALVMSKHRTNRLGFAILLTFFRERGRFPRDEAEVEAQRIAALSKQIDVPTPVDGEAFLTGRTAERLRGEIRIRFGFREATVADAEMLTTWLRDHVAGEIGGEIEPMIERLEAKCRELAIEPPTADRVERIARTALRAHEERFHAAVYERLSPTTRERLDALLRPNKAGDDNADHEDAAGSAPAVLLKLRGNRRSAQPRQHAGGLGRPADRNHPSDWRPCRTQG